MDWNLIKNKEVLLLSQREDFIEMEDLEKLKELQGDTMSMFGGVKVKSPKEVMDCLKAEEEDLLDEEQKLYKIKELAEEMYRGEESLNHIIRVADTYIKEIEIRREEIEDEKKELLKRVVSYDE